MNADECYRCGYDLRGIADDQPCPECGLLAERSRRVTDELHNTRPRWLRKLAWGINFILLAIAAAVAWPYVFETLQRHYYQWLRSTGWRRRPGLWIEWMMYTPQAGMLVAALLLLVGGFLLASREGYAPADRVDRARRILLRVAVAVPFLALVLHLYGRTLLWLAVRGMYFPPDWTVLQVIAAALATVGCVPLPLLVFFQLRSLAKRARSVWLAEHCAIVGIGTSCALLYVGAIWLLSERAEAWGFGTHWTGRSNVFLALLTLLFAAAILFVFWAVVLLVRFAIAFWRASRQLRRAWQRDDRSSPAEVTASPNPHS